MRLHSIKFRKENRGQILQDFASQVKDFGFYCDLICGFCAKKPFGQWAQKQDAVTITPMGGDEGLAMDDSNKERSQEKDSGYKLGGRIDWIC